MNKTTINISAIVTTEGSYPASVVPYITGQETRNDNGMFINAMGEIFCGTYSIGRIKEHGLWGKISTCWLKTSNGRW